MEASDLPILRRLAARYRADTPRPNLVLITHLLETAEPYIGCLNSIFDVHLIGIPYSSRPYQVSRLRSSGFKVTIPGNLAEIAPTAIELIQTLAASGPVIVQEIGGYLAAEAPKLARIPNFFGVVEDTNNGHWRYAANSNALEFPVLSIARSPLKAIEDSQIGPAVVFSVERIMRANFGRVLKGVNALVLGYGKVGRSTATALRGRDANVRVFDTDPVKMMTAHLDGYRVGSRDELLRQATLIVGASCHCSIDRSAFHCINYCAVLASASSRQIEFDIDEIKQSYTREVKSSTVTRYSAPTQSFFLLLDGYPVNFRDQSIIGDALDAVYSELFLCILEIAERRVPPGLADSGPVLHRKIGEVWQELNLPAVEAAGAQGLRIAPRSEGFAYSSRRDRRIG